MDQGVLISSSFLLSPLLPSSFSSKLEEGLHYLWGSGGWSPLDPPLPPPLSARCARANPSSTLGIDGEGKSQWKEETVSVARKSAAPICLHVSRHLPSRALAITAACTPATTPVRTRLRCAPPVFARHLPSSISGEKGGAYRRAAAWERGTGRCQERIKLGMRCGRC